MKPLILAGLWCLTLAAAFFAGKTFSGRESMSSLHAEAPPANSAELAQSSDTAFTTAPSDEAPTSLAPSTRSPLSLANGLNQVATLSETETRQLLDEALALPASDPQRSRTVISLLARLAETNPIAAIQLAEEIDAMRDGQRARERILEVWAGNDPTAALQWASEEMADAPIATRHSHMQAVLRGYASVNPEAAFQYASSLDESTRIAQRFKSNLMEEVLETQIENGGLADARITVEQMPDGQMKNEMLREVVDEWASFDPVAAADYVSSLGDAASSRLKASLVSEWAENDPQSAADWLSTLPDDDPAIPYSTAAIIREWTRYDMEAPADWLNSLPASKDLDRAVASYTYRAAQQDPEGAMTWAESIVSDDLRGRMMQNVAGSWREVDPASFEDYLETAPLSAEQKTAFQQAEPSRGSRGGFRRR